MRHQFKLLLTALLLVTLSLVNVAANADSKSDEIFKKACVDAWMKRATSDTDKVSFQNFGEKYCACAVSKPMDTDADVTKTAKTCISQTLLRDSMDSIEDAKGLKNLTADKISKACNDAWKLVYPSMGKDEKAFTDSYCQCATPKLMDLNAGSDNVTDSQWYDKISGIADKCSNIVNPGSVTAK